MWYVERVEAVPSLNTDILYINIKNVQLKQLLKKQSNKKYVRNILKTNRKFDEYHRYRITEECDILNFCRTGVALSTSDECH